MSRLILGIVTVLFISLSMNPFSTQAAIADGTYTINYQVNKPGSSSASMANDYFAKPAKLIVQNGKMTMQLTIKNSSWVTEFNPPGGAKVISSNAAGNQRVVQFSVASASLVTIAMTIDIEDIDYHHSYSVDFVFNSSELPQAQVVETKIEETKPEPSKPTASNQTNGSNTSLIKPATSETTDKNSSESQPGQEKVDEQAEDSVSEDKQAEGNEVEENPETSDEIPLISLIVFILAMIVLSRTKQTKTNY